MICEACCKINLGLDVQRRRDDGYHELETVMMPVRGLYDTIEIEPSERCSFAADGIAVDCQPQDNLCLRAWRLMAERYGVGSVRIVLHKRVPFGAGLGGGSSDATAVVMALNEMFSLGLSEPELLDCASALGSDTAFFVRSTPQLCTGRGETMTPAALDLGGLWLLVAKPSEGVSTREAYAGVRPHVKPQPLAERIARPVAEWQGSVVNDFEEHILAAHPAIAQIKRALLDSGALYASMSGSGSAVFGLFASRPAVAFTPDVFVHVEKL